MGIICNVGTVDLTVPAGERIVLSAENATCFISYSSFPLSPELWYSVDSVKNSAKLLDAVIKETKVRLTTSGSGTVYYSIGESPRIVARYEDKLGIGMVPATETIDIYGNIKLTGSVNGGAYVENIVSVTNTISDPYQITDTQSGTLFTNEGSSELVYINLPDATPGLMFQFYIQSENGFHVKCKTGSTIRTFAQATSDGGYIESTSIDSLMILKAINSTEWATLGGGQWQPS